MLTSGMVPALFADDEKDSLLNQVGELPEMAAGWISWHCKAYHHLQLPI